MTRLLLGCVVFLCAALTAGLSPATASAQATQNYKFGETDRQRGQMILRMVREDLKENYYDPTFHGLDVEALFKKAEELLVRAQSNNEIWEAISSVLMLLNDSHTVFLPPTRMVVTNYGWEAQMVGDKCFVVQIEPGSDAEKNLKVGDQVLAIGGRVPTRNNLWVLDYVYDVLRPMSGKHVYVQSPDGARREVDVMAEVRERKLVAVTPWDKFENSEAWRASERWRELHKNRFQEIGGDVLVWKMPTFLLSEQAAADSLKKVRKHRALILDLRGNGGGYVASLRRMIGYFFDREVKIGQERTRKKTRDVTSNHEGGTTFKGELVVLVDSNSASAAEVFARVMQLEKRGAVVGDRTAGMVVTSVRQRYCSVSVSDLLMSDGARLEHVGVMPDVLLLPTASDLAARRDPALAHAASMLGVKIDPERAGALFPLDWSKLPPK
jgi:C-terminal processing protease CtpA/Prc